MKLPGYRNASSSGVPCALSASSAEELDSGTGFLSDNGEGEVMATATQSAYSKELDPQNRSSRSRHFKEELWQRVVGQDVALQVRVDLYLYFPQVGDGGKKA